VTAPERIGRYRVLGLLGEGAMGVVYRGRDDILEREVALKLMSATLVAEPGSRERFLREARAVARLQHPNIVTIYELGDHESSPFIAMELLEGVDLQRAIEAGIRPDPRGTLPIILHLLAGLGHAHEHGIVHRDVKPSNLFLPRGRPAKIMDFGVARLGQAATSTGLVVGTPNYMSPEQVRGQSVDGRSDLFSAGLILYELVTGEKAYRADSVVSIMYKIAHQDPDLTLLPRGADWEGLRGTITRALARDPAQRFPDARSMAAEVAAALQAFGGSLDGAMASDLGLMVRVTPRPQPAPDFSHEPTFAESVPTQPPPLSPRRRSLWLPIAGGGAAAAAVLAAVLALRPGPEPASGVRQAATPTTTAPAPSRHPTPASTAPSSPPSAPPSARPSPASPAPSPAVAAPPVEPTPPPEVFPQNASIEKASDLLEKGRFAAALVEAKAVLRREPGNAEAREVAEEAEAGIVIETRIRNAREALKRGDKEAAIEEIRAGLAVRATDARLIALFREATQ
jgi:serine/threonine protein kinase